MQTLKPFKFNWKELNDALNAIVSVVNCNSPLEGQNVKLEEHGEQGVSINSSVGGKNDQGQGGGGGGGGQGGQWTTVWVMDDQCNKTPLQVWAQPLQ